MPWLGSDRRRRPSSTLLLTAAFALVLLAGITAFAMALRSAEMDALVTRSFVTSQTAMQLLSQMQDIETGQRGYLLTLQESYLEPFKAGERGIDETLRDLRAITAENAAQHARVEKLAPLVAEGRKAIDDLIDLARQGRQSEAVALVRGGGGKALMDGIRAEVAAISRASSELLAERQTAAASARAWLLTLVGGSLALAVALAGFLAQTAQRALSAERMRSRELENEIAVHRETQDSLRQAQKIEAVGQLTGGIAHDFNNLLTIIMGNLDTLRRRLSAPEGDAATLAAKLSAPVDLALQGAKSAAQLTHRLLAFSRRQALEPTALDLNRLVSGMSDMLRRTLGETIDIETILTAGVWPTFADTSQVENALINLCVNARDAMPNGGKLTIETANTFLDEGYTRQFGDIAPGQYVMLSVTDTGAGIPAELMARAFEPFFTTKSAGHGSGLGLAMVHGFVKQSGGHVRIYSEVDHGTTVKIYLPRHMQEEAITAPLPRPAVQGTPRAAANETILLVEDNDGVRAFATEALEELGYTVVAAADADKALAAFDSAGRVDLLFTDVVLPGKSGRALADSILAKRPDLPVLFTTGYTKNAIIHHGRLDPGVQLLSKPFAQHDLARKVREMLDRK